MRLCKSLMSDTAVQMEVITPHSHLTACITVCMLIMTSTVPKPAQLRSPALLNAYGRDKTPAPMQELQSVKTEENDVAPLVEPNTILVLRLPSSTSSMITLATAPSSTAESKLCRDCAGSSRSMAPFSALLPIKVWNAVRFSQPGPFSAQRLPCFRATATRRMPQRTECSSKCTGEGRIRLLLLSDDSLMIAAAHTKRGRGEGKGSLITFDDSDLVTQHLQMPIVQNSPRGVEASTHLAFTQGLNPERTCILCSCVNLLSCTKSGEQ